MDLARQRLAYERRYRAGAPPWSHDLTFRQELVAQALPYLPQAPLRILDIGCGDGRATTWVCNERSSSWFGIDFLLPDTLNLRVPLRGQFLQAAIRTSLDEVIPPHEQFDLIVDLGSVFICLSSNEERLQYLDSLRDHLHSDGIIALLSLDGPNTSEVISDGRTRSYLSGDSFQQSISAARLSTLYSIECVVEAHDPRNSTGHRLQARYSLLKRVNG